jgi:hypothetical protein
MASGTHLLSVGTLVRHLSHPEWGLGKVLEVGTPTLTVYFRDFPELKPGDAVKKIQKDFVGIADTQSDA